MIKNKTSYHFNFRNFHILIKNKSKDFFLYFSISIFLFLLLNNILTDFEFVISYLLFQSLFFTSFLLMLIEFCNNENLEIIKKQITKCEYKEKCIPYSKFEKKYKEAKI